MKRLTLALAVIALAWLAAGCAAQSNGVFAGSAPLMMAVWLFVVSAAASLTGCGGDNDTGFVVRHGTTGSTSGTSSGNTAGGTTSSNTTGNTAGQTNGSTSSTQVATKLAFVNQPGTLPVHAQTNAGGLAAVTPLPDIEVAVEDANGNVVTTANGFSITLSVASSSLNGGHLFPSDPTAPVLNGVATFHNVELSLAGVYTLLASVTSPSLASATSNSFTVGPLPVDFAARIDIFESLTEGGASVVSADFNQDGHPDLLLSRGYGDPYLTLLLTNGDGSFKPPQQVSSGFVPVSGGPLGAGLMVVADLNGDQHADVVVAPAEYYYPSVGPMVLRGHGDGTFDAPVPVATGFHVAAMTVADFDGDLKPDLAVASGYPQFSLDATQVTALQVLKGNGDGTFGGTLLSTTTATPVLGLAAGDFNHDLNLDLAAITTATKGGSSGSLLIFNGNGSHLVTPPQTHVINGFSPTAIVAHDFDGDGADDLVVAAAHYVSGPLPTTPGAYDGRIGIYFGNAGSLINGPQFATNGAALSLQTVDVNADNHSDVVGFAANQGRVFDLLSNGDRTFGALHENDIGNNGFTISGIPVYLSPFAVGDFDGDGHIDIATANYIGLNLSLLHGNGDGSFFNAPTLLANPNAAQLYYPTGVTVADLGDGHPSLLWNGTPPVYLHGNGSVFIERSNGDGTFGALTSIPVPAAHGGPVVLGDFNNDTHPDLLLTPASGAVSAIVLPGNGDGTFGPPRTSPLGISNVIGLFLTQDAVADFDGDNHLDLAMTNNKGIYVAFGNGDGTFKPAVNVAPESHNTISIVATADLNGDNVPDFIAATNTGIDVRLGHRVGSSFQLSAPVSIAIPNFNDFLFVTGDFNGDGHLDFAAAQWHLPGAPYLGGQIDIFLGNGDGTFSDGQAIEVDRLPTRLVATDINLDGQTDLLAVNDLSNNVSVLTGNGDGTFALITPFFGTGQAPSAMFVGDINGDGRPDLITGNILSGDMSVLFHR
jgi:hypothetical protein